MLSFAKLNMVGAFLAHCKVTFERLGICRHSHCKWSAVAMDHEARRVVYWCSQGTAHEEEEEEEVDEGAEEDVPTPVRRSRRQASQVSQGTSLAATDLPAVSTGRALSALQAASALQTAAAQPAASAQPSMSHPVSRIQSHTVSTVASPTVSGARWGPPPPPSFSALHDAPAHIHMQAWPHHAFVLSCPVVRLKALLTTLLPFVYPSLRAGFTNLSWGCHLGRWTAGPFFVHLDINPASSKLSSPKT